MEFFGVTRIVVGRGEAKGVGAMARALGGRALLVHAGEVAAGSAGGAVRASLEEAGVAVVAVRQRGEPTVDDVDGAARTGRAAGCDVVVGVGGGSAIDAAKAVAGLLTNGGEATDYMEVVGKGQKITRPAAPWLAVSTTGGTGAEVTRNAVVALPERQFKASIRSEHLLPRAAVIDPELHVNIPPAVTAASGMDALCQCVEAYTSTGANALTDPLALRGVVLAARSLRRAVADGRDLDAREEMALAALFSGIALTNAGLGAVHGLAAPLGANFPVPHGVVCAALLPHVVAANIAALRSAGGDHPTLRRYAEVGRALAGSAVISDDVALEACAAIPASMAKTLNIPALLAYGITNAHVITMVDLARKASSMRYNPIVLADDALAAVLSAGIRGG